MSYTYASFVTAVSKETVIAETNVDFIAIMPTIIDQAEQRCYRELQLLATIVRDSSGSTTPSQRLFTLPQTAGRFVIAESFNVLDGADRYPLTKVSREVMDVIWPSEDAVDGYDRPVKYAPLTDQTVLLGPATGSPLTIEVVGTIRPTPLSASNTTTFLSQYLPDLFLAAAMVAMSGYMRNFGAQGDDPKMALSWEGDYKTRFGSANMEETRRKFQAFASTGGA